MGTDLGELYASARHRIGDLVLSSPADQHDAVCPATPMWTVHDVVAHVRGITEDIRLGNVGGAGTDPWTAEQIERHRATTMSELIEGWAADAPLIEGVLSSPGGESVARVVVDVHAHEIDVRGALGRPAPLPDDFADWVTPMFADQLIGSVAAAGKPGVRVVTTDGDEYGDADAPVALTIDRFELFRAMMGRRSPAQVAAFDWGGSDATPYLEHVFMFGPRETDLHEPR